MFGEGKRAVPVIVDGNNHDLIDPVNGKRLLFQTEVVNNIVTMDKCKSIIEALRNEYNYEPKSLKIDLCIYTKTPGNEYGDFPEECLLHKIVTYGVQNNRLRVWQNRDLVYENWDGEISRDPVALADTYL